MPYTSTFKLNCIQTMFHIFKCLLIVKSSLNSSLHSCLLNFSPFSLLQLKHVLIFHTLEILYGGDNHYQLLFPHYLCSRDMLTDPGEMPDHQYVCTRIRLSSPDNLVLLPVFPYVRAYQICICQKTWASDLICLIEKFFSFNV